MTALRIQEEANIYMFPVIEGTGKRRKDGGFKQTHSNAKAGRSTWVDPIRELDDIYRIIDYLQRKSDQAVGAHKKAHDRNKLYFCIGIFSGFRVSDMLQLRWSDIFEDDGKTYRERVGIKEKKTGKIKDLITTKASRKYIDEYVKRWNPNTASDEYVFQNYNGEAINRQTVDNFIKSATKAIGLKGSYSTHTVRKTYAYQYFMFLRDEGEAFALSKVQFMLGHENPSTTLRYLGITQKSVSESMEDFADAMMKDRG